MDTFKKLALLGFGAISYTKEKADILINDLIAKGELTKDEGEKIFDTLISKGEKNKEELQKIISKTFNDVITKTPFISKNDLTDINKKLTSIEEKLDLLLKK